MALRHEAAEGIVARGGIAALPEQRRHHRRAHLLAGTEIEVGLLQPCEHLVFEAGDTPQLGIPAAGPAHRHYQARICAAGNDVVIRQRSASRRHPRLGGKIAYHAGAQVKLLYLIIFLGTVGAGAITGIEAVGARFVDLIVGRLDHRYLGGIAAGNILETDHPLHCIVTGVAPHVAGHPHGTLRICPGHGIGHHTLG